MEHLSFNKHLIKIFSCLIIFFMFSEVLAANRTINLVLAYKTVYFTGQPIKAIAVNNQIPAPTLHFKQGDDVTINVHNCLNQEAAIHWHGVLVPWQMDGVLGVSQRGIKPGRTFKYHFKLMQSGTYWYHAHAELQEQQGLYGAFIIDPPKRPRYRANKDFVVVLSDWSNTHPDQIMANLKKSGDFYSPRFPLQPSLAKFICDYQKANCEERKNLLEDYSMMQQMRMSIYDINDVAYDAFLLNGHSKCHPWTAIVKVGDIVRLRFIGAGSETIFHVKIPCTSVQMVHVQGNDVKPYIVNDFTVAPGETYDILVKIEKDEAYIIYAESADTVGSAIGALLTSPYQFVDYASVLPFSEPLPVTREMMNNMMMSHMKHGSMNMDMNEHAMMQKHKRASAVNHQTHMHSHTIQHSTMQHDMNMHAGITMSHEMSMQHHMAMPTEPTVIGDTMVPPSRKDIMEIKTVGTKYQDLAAAIETNHSNKPIKEVIKLELFGYMNHFIWMINGLPEYKAKPIIVEPASRYRLIFTNNSMMHHPMHIHGHWFILRNGHGDYDPLLHTIDVPPGSTVVADVDTDASGQWFFHCHMIYHMAAGLSRVFQYATLIEIINCEAQPQDIVKFTHHHNRPIVRVDEATPIDVSLVNHPMGHHTKFWLATLLDISEDPFNNVQRVTFKGLYGYDYNKLELFTNDAEIKRGTVENADIDVFYWHLLYQFWAVKAGVNYFYRPAKSPYWQPGIGIEGLMPYFIDTNIRGYYRSGSAKLDIELARDTQISNNFFLRLGIRSILASKTVKRLAVGSGINQMRYIARPYYRLMPGLNILAEFEYEQSYGAFKKILRNEGEETKENTVTFGVSVLF